MAEVGDTLLRCFEITFPEVDRALIPHATVEAVEQWDSLRSLTLLAVIEEEFGVEIPLEELPDLQSFEAFEDYLRAAGARSQG